MSEKARPIISYMLSWNAKLGQLVGTLVYELYRSVFGELQLDCTVQDIITAIQKLQQQDLSGFFNSAPHSRMIEAVTYAVNHYIAHKGVAPNSKLSTSLALEDRAQRIFRGRFRQAGRKYLNTNRSHSKDRRFFSSSLVFYSGRSVFSPNSRCFHGQSFCSCLLWPCGSFPGILFPQSFWRNANSPSTVTQQQVCRQSRIRYTFPVCLIFDRLEDLLAIFEQKYVTRQMLRCTQRTPWQFLTTSSTHPPDTTYHDMDIAWEHFLIDAFFIKAGTIGFVPTQWIKMLDSIFTWLGLSQEPYLEMAGAKPSTPMAARLIINMSLVPTCLIFVARQSLLLIFPLLPWRHRSNSVYDS